MLHACAALGATFTYTLAEGISAMRGVYHRYIYHLFKLAKLTLFVLYTMLYADEDVFDASKSLDESI